MYLACIHIMCGLVFGVHTINSNSKVFIDHFYKQVTVFGPLVNIGGHILHFHCKHTKLFFIKIDL